MKDFDYIILGGGCSGLSLAYHLDLQNKLKNKTLAIIEPRGEYVRDKTWSFWKVKSHYFEDCLKKSWDKFNIKIPNKTKDLECKNYPYQSIDSGLFYKKIINRLKENKNIFFFKSQKEINTNKSIIFNSVPEIEKNQDQLWQHFCGYEIETENDIFDENTLTLMDFDCDQQNKVHFFYILPFSNKKALIETTWISKLEERSTNNNYENELEEYIRLKLKTNNYKVKFKENGAIPLFLTNNKNKKNYINIGTAGGMTRLSTGYTFLNIQKQSEYIAKNIDIINDVKAFKIAQKYKFLDEIFLKVLDKNPDLMTEIFYNMFQVSTNSVIKFLSNESNMFEDTKIIMKMPKLIFLRALLSR